MGSRYPFCGVLRGTGNSTNVEFILTEGGGHENHVSMNVELAAAQLEALGNPTRLRIYRALVRAGHVGLPVAQVQERLGIPASTLSHHLQRLIRNGLVSQERQATTLICRAVYPAMNALLGFLADECCIDEGCSAGSEQAA
ncbi:hypothetical protein BOSEA31B_14274 [Hyphomicrobiales bacterium]|nr:hypothetical protein BOSEA31B_14274 [Hyphomicrobiales bacterium]CAH1700052.1 hypothetical protein BOSEA1005_13105 [Hyphomicrobiales bacterium]